MQFQAATNHCYTFQQPHLLTVLESKSLELLKNAIKRLVSTETAREKLPLGWKFQHSSRTHSRDPKSHRFILNHNTLSDQFHNRRIREEQF